jgi:general secretion pathway protein I
MNVVDLKAEKSVRRAIRKAFTLLEVILALAILAGSVAITGELLRGGILDSQSTRDLTRGEMVAESVMSQVVTGALAPSGVSDAAYEDDTRWLYTIAVESGQQQGLLVVSVTVRRDAEAGIKVTPFRIVRWMVDPEYDASVTAAQTALLTVESSQ